MKSILKCFGLKVIFAFPPLELVESVDGGNNLKYMKIITSENYLNTPTSIIDTRLFYKFFGKLLLF